MKQLKRLCRFVLEEEKRAVCSLLVHLFTYCCPGSESQEGGSLVRRDHALTLWGIALSVFCVSYLYLLSVPILKARLVFTLAPHKTVTTGLKGVYLV